MNVVDADMHLAVVTLLRLSKPETRPPSFAWTHDMLIVCVPYGECTFVALTVPEQTETGRAAVLAELVVRSLKCKALRDALAVHRAALGAWVATGSGYIGAVPTQESK